MTLGSKQISFRLVFLSLFLGAAVIFTWSSYKPAKPQACIADFCLRLEVMTKKEDMERGLQGREFLREKEGMLFVFPKDGFHRFWMKDMKMSIDILWLDSSGKIVSMGENLLPCLQDPCSIYAPSTSSRYVLEVQAGFLQKHGVKTGDIIILKGV